MKTNKSDFQQIIDILTSYLENLKLKYQVKSLEYEIE